MALCIQMCTHMMLQAGWKQGKSHKHVYFLSLINTKKVIQTCPEGRDSTDIIGVCGYV